MSRPSAVLRTTKAGNDPFLSTVELLTNDAHSRRVDEVADLTAPGDQSQWEVSVNKRFSFVEKDVSHYFCLTL